MYIASRLANATSNSQILSHWPEPNVDASIERQPVETWRAENSDLFTLIRIHYALGPR